MAKLITLYWRGIPARVIAKKGRRSAKVQLSSRFQRAIDRAAMRAGKGRSDVYLSDWRREITTCGDDLDVEAQTWAHRLEEQFTNDDLLALIRAHGKPLQSIS
tara:strand:+ start:983 stop:1291 length:309 start_codon:yes stop_codon:yes gene_type:complete